MHSPAPLVLLSANRILAVAPTLLPGRGVMRLLRRWILQPKKSVRRVRCPLAGKYYAVPRKQSRLFRVTFWTTLKHGNLSSGQKITAYYFGQTFRAGRFP